MTRNELAQRYAGSVLGMSWVALAPALILTLYAVVYFYVYRVRVPGLPPAAYVLYIFAGLVPYLMTAEALGTGVGSVVANKAVLANTVFPIDLAPVKSVLLAQATMAVGMAMTVAGAVVLGLAHWTLFLLPLVWLLHVAALCGVTWFLSLLNVVFRDLQAVIGVVLMLVMIISPIAYTPDMVPSGLKPLLILNPFSYFVVAYQRVIVVGLPPTTDEWLAMALQAFVLFGLGGAFFARAKSVLIDYV